MAGIQDQMKQLESRVAFLLEDSNNNRLKMFDFERVLKGTKDKLEETEKTLEETEKKLEESRKKQEEMERRLSRTDKLREEAQIELHDHLSKCQPHLRSASSTEDVTIREEMSDLGKKMNMISNDISKVHQLKSFLEMSLIKKATKSNTEADRIDDMQSEVNNLNDDLNELKKTTAKLARELQLRQVTTPDNQGQLKASQGLPTATPAQPIGATGQTMATTGHAIGLQGQQNASQVQSMAVSNSHYYSSVCLNIEVDHMKGILRFRRNWLNIFAQGKFKSARPLSQQCSSFSVEITGRGHPSSFSVAIGLADKDWDIHGGLSVYGAVGYWDDDQVRVSGQIIRRPGRHCLSVGDVMKIGVTFAPRRSFQCYENGREVFNHPLEAADFPHREFYPVIRLWHPGTSVRLLEADAWRA